MHFTPVGSGGTPDEFTARAGSRWLSLARVTRGTGVRYARKNSINVADKDTAVSTRGRRVDGGFSGFHTSHTYVRDIRWIRVRLNCGRGEKSGRFV